MKLNNDIANLALSASVALCLAISRSQAEPTDSWVQDYVVQFLSGKEENPFGAGVYLGNGLVITAAHVCTRRSPARRNPAPQEGLVCPCFLSIPTRRA